MSLIFSPSDHTYTLDGQQLLSVTQLIRAEGLMTGIDWATDEGRERGTAVHQAIHYLSEGDLDLESLDSRVAPYVWACERFMADTQAETLMAEVPLASRRYRYAGTLDWLGWMNGNFTLLDFKSGAFQPWQEIQLELYRRLVAENADVLGIDERIHDVYVVQLKADGGYKIHSPAMTLTRIQALTNSILTLHLWRLENAA